MADERLPGAGRCDLFGAQRTVVEAGCADAAPQRSAARRVAVADADQHLCAARREPRDARLVASPVGSAVAIDRDRALTVVDDREVDGSVQRGALGGAAVQATGGAFTARFKVTLVDAAAAQAAARRAEERAVRESRRHQAREGAGRWSTFGSGDSSSSWGGAFYGGGGSYAVGRRGGTGVRYAHYGYHYYVPAYHAPSSYEQFLVAFKALLCASTLGCFQCFFRQLLGKVQ